jgi:hypothetical protein
MSLKLSRRAMLGAGFALSIVPWRAAFAAAPVVTMHGDRLWIDHSGTAKAYRPPAGFGFVYCPETFVGRVYS